MAASHNFNLNFTEFTSILNLPTKEKAEILMFLSSAEDLNIYLYHAIHDALLVADENARDYPWIYKGLSKEKERLSRLEGWKNFAEFEALALYRLATRVVPWGKDERGHPPEGDLAFLSKFVVKGDTWRTFMSFHEAWKNEKPEGIEGLLEYIPEWNQNSSASEWRSG